MNRSWGVLLLLAALTLSGCLPSAPSQADEEKELHFLEGRSRVNSLDYAGAIESFEKALEANPQSASAHFELGWLFDQKEPDPAAAIYHYQKYLALRPKAENAEAVKGRIAACKGDLAKGVDLGPLTAKQQHDLDKLAEDNRQLTEQVKQLSDEVAKWRAYYGRTTPPTNAPTRAVSSGRLAQTSESTQVENGTEGTTSNVASGGHSTASGARTHVVKAGETLHTIARRYGLRVETLLSANPHLDPRRLRPGQSVNIP